MAAHTCVLPVAAKMQQVISYQHRHCLSRVRPIHVAGVPLYNIAVISQNGHHQLYAPSTRKGSRSAAGIRCMATRDYYEALGVGKDASPSEIRRAYDELVKNHLLDVDKDNPKAVEGLQIINRAYEVLKDNNLRSLYDEVGLELFENSASSVGSNFGGTGHGFWGIRIPGSLGGRQKLNVNPRSDPFTRWNVPWDGQTVLITMTSFGVSFLLIGVSISVAIPLLGIRQRQFMDLDGQALLIFVDQLLQTIVGVTVIDSCIKSHKPLSKDFFNYDWKDPFDVNRGWLLWGLVGIVSGAAAITFAGIATTALNGQPLPREEQDALLQLLPLIGASKIRTALLLAVTGVLAPYLEETVFRGFLMTSLTKWMPTSGAVILSAIAFALAHFTPAEIPQLFALGLVLGFSYAKSRNLLTPIMIHALWNSGVVILLTFLRVQGYDIQEII